MTNLKLGPLADDRPAKLTIELPAPVYRDLQTYAQLLAQASADPGSIEPARLIAPMLERFMASDRGFLKARRRHIQLAGSTSE